MKMTIFEKITFILGVLFIWVFAGIATIIAWIVFPFILIYSYLKNLKIFK